MVKEKILGFDICCDNQEELIKEIFQDYENNTQIVIANINPEIIINNYKNPEFINNINNQKYQIPDGIGIIYASKINKGQIKKRITGIDFMDKILQESIKYNAKIYLYGTRLPIIEKAKEELENKYKNINIVGISDGYKLEEEVINDIKIKEPDILFIGTGSPKQENFIFKYKNEIKNTKIIMPVGGSFDVISNSLKRAPNWMIKLNLEWLYRLIKQPTRFFRQLKLISFMKCVINYKIKNN